MFFNISSNVPSKSKAGHWKMYVAIIWLVFTFSLATWWIVFIYGLLNKIVSLQPALKYQIDHNQNMIMMEGVSLLFLLVLGGVPLIYLLLKEEKRTLQLREFFAAFTHDLKTSLSSVRLQTEILEEDLSATPQGDLVRRLIADTSRLEMQLENSLFFVHANNKMFLEPVDVLELVKLIGRHWPELEIKVVGNKKVFADRRGLESVFKNIIQNAVIHGKAREVIIRTSEKEEWVELLVSDDGLGFQGDFLKIGEVFKRHTGRSGSGLGLHIVKTLMEKMNGDVDFLKKRGAGFQVSLKFKSKVGPGCESMSGGNQ